MKKYSLQNGLTFLVLTMNIACTKKRLVGVLRKPTYMLAKFKTKELGGAFSNIA